MNIDIALVEKNMPVVPVEREVKVITGPVVITVGPIEAPVVIVETNVVLVQIVSGTEV